MALFYYIINITIPNRLHENKLQGSRPEAQISLLSLAEAFKPHTAKHYANVWPRVKTIRIWKPQSWTSPQHTSPNFQHSFTTGLNQFNHAGASPNYTSALFASSLALALAQLWLQIMHLLGLVLNQIVVLICWVHMYTQHKGRSKEA